MGIQIDNPTDISCNKLSALFDRAEPKDFVDVYFIAQELLSFDQLVALTRQKHLGIDDYWLAVALAQVEHVELLPRMVKPISLSELKVFFLARAKEIMPRPAGHVTRKGLGLFLSPCHLVSLSPHPPVPSAPCPLPPASCLLPPLSRPTGRQHHTYRPDQDQQVQVQRAVL